jgi:DNA helicase-2/ATP-dependent DNA helicase PcrA
VPAPAAVEDVLRRSEVRDVLAWMRLLLDPHDASAVVRALARPPVELRQVDLARVIQLARRRRLDLVGGLAAATESPQVPPEARERIQRFLALHRAFAAEIDRAEPAAFVGGLIERLGTRGRTLLAPEEAAEQRASLAGLSAITADFLRSSPGASAREAAAHLAALVPHQRSSGPAQPEGTAAGEAPPPAGEDAAGTDAEAERLQDTLQMLRAAVLDSVARIGGQVGELRLDTDLDISHGVVRYLELLKVSALMQRPEGQGLQEALADVNARLLAATTPLEREIFLTSALDDALLAEGLDERAWAQAIAPRGEPSLGPFLPRRGQGLALSASDVETYRSCPLRYKFARVLRIPTEQTLSQRFGIAVHQVLERYHSVDGSSLESLFDLLDAGWRRSGLGDGERERELYEMARTALRSYHARLQDDDATPVWFERAFSFRLGPHQVRGRVDRVDRLREGAGDAYELIDYKTSRPKTVEQLQDDVQLSLYALAAREAWGLECSRQAYYYVLDDVKVPVPRGERDAATVEEIVLEVGEGILAQRFEPTPSQSACSICDHRIVCPAAEV